MLEIWKDVIGTDGEYSVSNHGRVRCNGRFVNHTNGKRWVKPRIRKVSYPKNHYPRISIKRGMQTTLHRLLAIHFIPNPNNLPFINHKDGDKHNHSLDNLEWCTRQENEDHAYGAGLKNSTGSNNAMAKINETMVSEIKKLHGIKSTKELSIIYGVHVATINRIVGGKIWKHVI